MQEITEPAAKAATVRVVCNFSNLPQLFWSSLRKCVSCTDCGNRHTVTSSDTCFALATANNLNLTYFQQLNPTVDCNNLQLGSSVCLGDGEQTDPA